jgi:hypothetical protein
MQELKLKTKKLERQNLKEIFLKRLKIKFSIFKRTKNIFNLIFYFFNRNIFNLISTSNEN